jgi:putative addiction module killer protein
VEARPRDILFFEAGRVSEWLDQLENSDQGAYDAIVARLERLEDGNLGDYDWTGNVIELRFIRTGPGYRLYVGLDGDLAIILWAGIKKTQDADVRIANRLWKEYKDA